MIPFGITMVIFAWGAWLFFGFSRPPDNAHEVFVVGKQWMWKLQHMEGKREINELHVPIGQAVRLTMTSEDVIHSFYIPAFRMKFDVLPGATPTWFEAARSAVSPVRRYCGTEHSGMIGHRGDGPPISRSGSPSAARAPPGAARLVRIAPIAAGEAYSGTCLCLPPGRASTVAVGPSAR